jgi:SSS family transporter
MVSITSPLGGYVLIAGFGGFAILASLYLTRNSGGGTEDLLVARGSTTTPIVIVSLIATWLWSTTLMGAAEGAFSFGLPAFWVYGFTVSWSAILMGPILVRIRQNFPDVSSFPEYIRYRFGNEASEGKLVHGTFTFVALFQSTAWAIIQITGAGIVLSSVFGLPHWQAAMGVGLVVTTYVTLGGLRASIMTDFIQMFAIGVLLAIVVPWAILEAGGPSAIHAGITAADASVPQANHFVTPSVVVGWLLVSAASVEYTFINQNVWQRVIAADEVGDIKKIIGIAAVLWLAIPAAASLIGLVGIAEGYTGSATEVMPWVMSEVLPSWGAALFAIVVIGAIFSTTDSCLNSVSTILISDVYKPYFGSEEEVRTSKSLVTKTKIMMVGIGVLVTIIGTNQFSLLFVSLAAGALTVPLAWPTAISVLLPDFNRKWGAYSVLVGVVMAIFFGLLPTAGIWANPPFEPWQGYVLPNFVTILGPLVGTYLYPDTDHTFEDMNAQIKAETTFDDAAPADD